MPNAPVTAPAVLLVAVTARTEADRDRLARGLEAVTAEDPTIRCRRTATGSTIIGGLGELHLELVLHRLRREFDVEAEIGRPQVAYQERLTCPADGEMKYSGVASNRLEYAHARVHVYPGKPGSGYVFDDELMGGAIPPQFVRPVQYGIRVALSRGVLAGYPMDDVRVVLYDGSYHDSDSSEQAFKVAGFGALYDAARRARPVLVEPVMRVEVTVDEEFLDDVVGNLMGRRGQLLSLQDRGGMRRVEAHVPLAQMFGYATDLRQRTRGRAAFGMHFERYQPCEPPSDDSRRDDALVGAPLKPAPPLRNSRIALDEPVEEDLDWSGA